MTGRAYRFDPFEVLELDYPDWHVTAADLGGRGKEIICASRKLIVLDLARFDGDAVWAFTHALTHIQNDEEGDDAPQELREAEVELLVRLRVGR